MWWEGPFCCFQTAFICYLRLLFWVGRAQGRQISEISWILLFVCFTLVFQPFCDSFARQTENNRKQRDACLHISRFFIRTSLHSLNIRPSKKKNTITVIEAETSFWLASHINRGLQQYVGVASDLTARLRWPSGIHLLSLSSLLLPLKL